MQKTFKVLATILLFFITAVKPANALMDEVLIVEDRESEEVRVKAGEKVEQAFTSPTDKFGIVTVKFLLQERDDKIKVDFKIKQKGQENWIYKGTSTVHALDFYHDNGIPFPFGFPTIEDAEDKEYVFQIQPEKDITVLKTNGNLNFSVAKEKPAKELILNDLNIKINEDKAFFVMWIILIVSSAFFMIIY